MSAGFVIDGMKKDLFSLFKKFKTNINFLTTTLFKNLFILIFNLNIINQGF